MIVVNLYLVACDAFYAQSLVLMRKNVNIDISKDLPTHGKENISVNSVFYLVTF